MTRVLPRTRRTETYTLPRVPLDTAALRQPREALQALWVGHAAFLVQAHGWNILTDPVFSLRASPSQWAGPARHTPPACGVDDLPPIHLVLISHNHYDHIDADSIAALVAKDARDRRTAVAVAAAEAAGETIGFADGAAGAVAGSWPHHRPYAGTLFVCPLGVSPLLVDLGVPPGQVVELDWWQQATPGRATSMEAGRRGTLSPAASHVTVARITPPAETTFAGTVADSGPTHHGTHAPPPRAAVPVSPSAWPRITCVPAQHQSARTAFDRNTTLWCGYAVHVGDDCAPGAASGGAVGAAGVGSSGRAASDGTVSFYFTGDTGYRAVPEGVAPLTPEERALPRCPAFSQIGAALGPFDLGLMPTGAYDPRWFMSSFHASPEDSVDMFLDARVRRGIAMHWGTFTLTDEPIEEPIARLAAARAAAGIPPEAFVSVKTGGIVTASGGPLAPDHLATVSDRGAAILEREAAKRRT